MTRHGFVQEQRLHRPLRPARQRVDVRLEIAGAAQLRRAAHIVLGVVALLGPHRPNPVGESRQHRKKTRQHGVGALRDVAVAGEHVLGARVEELRVGVEPLLEFGARPGEARGRDRRVHLAADARHLREAEVVDLPRRHPRRRVERESRLVVADARRQRGGRDVLGGRRQVPLLVEVAQTAERRDHGRLDHASSRARDTFALRRRDVRRKVPERRIFGTLRGIRVELRVELARHPRDRDPRRHPSELHRLFHPGDQLVDQLRQRLEAREIGIVVADRGEARRVDETRQVELDSVELRDGRPEIALGARQRRAEAIERDALLELLAQDAQARRGPRAEAPLRRSASRARGTPRAAGDVARRPRPTGRTAGRHTAGRRHRWRSPEIRAASIPTPRRTARGRRPRPSSGQVPRGLEPARCRRE